MVESTVARRVIIYGLVQGVGYRAWTANRAHELGLSGWVRNRRDGTVEAVFQGADPIVNKILADCRHGPEFAEVTNVKVYETSFEACQAFEIRATI